MSYQLFLGFTYEGSTDERFLVGIIERTIADLIFQYGNKDVELLLIPIKGKGENFVSQSLQSIKKGFIDNSTDLFFIHCDADDKSTDDVIKYKFEKLYEELQKNNELIECKVIPIIPVFMSESWMLADFDLFKNEIFTNKTKAQLNISGNPENISNPKLRIIEALHIVNKELPKKRRKELEISDLYQILGQKIPLNKLLTLNSFKDFYFLTFNSLKELKLIDHTNNL